jgi:ADP-ribose pyrophosphatase YjhB (NUDIX family)
MNKFIIKWKKFIYDCEWFDEYDYEKLTPITGVHGFVFNDKNEVCIARVKKENVWSDLGGKPEKQDKKFEDTFIREVDEEADLDIKNIVRIGYIKVIPRHNPKKIEYQLRFTARVKKIKHQTIDPAEGTINDRKFIPIKDFRKYTLWGNEADTQLKKALEKLKNIS